MHDSPPLSKPSLVALVALVALAVVHRLRPAWVAVSTAEVARAEGEKPERISRLCSLVLGPFGALVDGLVRRGRPPRATPSDAGDLLLTRALLGVTTALLARVSLSRPGLRDLIVGAWLRLRNEAPAPTQQRFCEALALPERTLRAWLSRPRRAAPSAEEPAPSPPQSPGPKKRSRGLRRGRFGFEVLLPGTVVGADTTDTAAFGVPLKLVAAQDVGGRDAQLFDAVLVDNRESAEHVVRVFGEALAGRDGIQALTDQGTPYMAAETRRALEAAGAEHAPQREGHPQGKATVERAFRTLKGIAQPILDITDRIAASWPTVRNSAVAIATTSILFTALLRAYQAGARAARAADTARAGLDEDALLRAAAKSREKARADETSRRQLLAHLHAVYQFDISQHAFVHQFARYPLAVLREADARLRRQLHRDDIHSSLRYFAAIVRNVFADHRKGLARRERYQREQVAMAQQAAAQTERQRRWRADPASWLREALDAVVCHWRDGHLLLGGVGLGLGWLRASLRLLVARDGLPAVTDLATGALADLRLRHNDRLGDDGFLAVASLVHRELARVARQNNAPPNAQCPPPPPSATLWNIGRTTRPPAPHPLRI